MIRVEMSASVERPAAATDRISHDFFAWLVAEPQRSRRKKAFATIKVSGDPSQLQRCSDIAWLGRRLALHALAWRCQPGSARPPFMRMIAGCCVLWLGLTSGA